ncbi:Uncharacterised protein [Mycobacteroides abscessus subsp. abscessus]|uniref:hypothetical protein n=1 Tax=Mycobacteroides abscessus TaxID=36809 RepID=UPI00092A61D7|nr:hypothetical protein [Mycobacteroides abscessus]MBE5451227.1 hypothetical protein [Mycobacteroides abscessus]MBN7483187.1 hypothetical protein [Mycobacteroides abscessus subsp. massiliense]SHW52798.1 Uncharacterised protein [Mycobacteroides abscessus subsp. abscessus]SHX58173.1 Uncharacterised protein [Mycobacteroides abscessus subsp. abscessus]SIE78833.1 Uncharacterised protein [Mycobacteroides abscessus subsp. abscessus]
MSVSMVTSVLGIATGVTGLIAFAASFLTARSANQRQLRDRLRKQLRETSLACLVYFQREGWETVDRAPQFSFQALDQIHEDGLISPSRSHIERLKSILRDVHGRSTLQLSKAAHGPELHAQLTAENQRRLGIGWESLDMDSQKYLRALGKMDNHGLGGYWTYLRYRFIPAREYVN